jgi:hypothetical protein
VTVRAALGLAVLAAAGYGAGVTSPGAADVEPSATPTVTATVIPGSAVTVRMAVATGFEPIDPTLRPETADADVRCIGTAEWPCAPSASI